MSVIRTIFARNIAGNQSSPDLHEKTKYEIIKENKLPALCVNSNKNNERRGQNAMMTLQQIQYFITVCKYKSFTKAAEEMHISQPGISSAMKELERECKVTLFERRNNSLYITDAGVLFLREAKKMQRQYESMEVAVKTLSEGREFVRIGLATMFGNAVYPKLRRMFCQQYPEIEIFSVEDTVDALFQLLEQGKVDLVCCGTGEMVAGADCESLNIRESRLMFCVNRDHPLAKEKEVTCEMIGREPLVMLTDQFYQTQRLKKLFEEQNIPLHIIHNTNQAYTVLRFIRDGVAAGFLTTDIISEDEKLVGFPVPGDQVYKIALYWKKDVFQFSAAKKFIEITREYMKQIHK